MSDLVKLDLRKLLCPLPVIRLQDYLKSVPIGTQVQLFCTDPGVLHDIPTWCRIHGHRVITSSQQESDYIFRVEKGTD